MTVRGPKLEGRKEYEKYADSSFVAQPRSLEFEPELNIIFQNNPCDNIVLRYISIYSLFSIPTKIKNTYPKISNGKVKEFTSLEGAFGVPYGTNNLAETLEGQVSV